VKQNKINELLKLKRTLIMGILNVTPDSFSDGGLFVDTDKAVEHAKQMVADGADIIDVGGESSRPGSDPVSEEEELNRVKKIVSRLVNELDVPISIDTYKPTVAEACLKTGASIVNDISGFRDQKMIDVAAKHKAVAVIMHMQGKPKNMQQNPEYTDVIKEISEFLKNRITECRKAGIEDIVVDPGIGFGKKTEHNLEILRRLHEFKRLGCPILIGTSRKAFIGAVTGGLPVEERMEGTIASVAVAVMNGAKIVRVHDVKKCKRAVMVADGVCRGIY
jgi:dihydropteroate synthase